MATDIETRARQHLAMDPLTRPHLWVLMTVAEVSQEKVDAHLRGESFALDMSGDIDIKGPLCYVCEETAASAMPFCPGDPEA